MRSQWWLFLVISLMWTMEDMTASYAADASSSQALQQLKILQKRLATPKEAKDVAGKGSSKEVVQNDDALIDEQAFTQTKKSLFPLDNEKIEKINDMFLDNELASQLPNARTPPRPTATSQFVNLSPGSTPPVIRLAQGFVSSLVFLDATGAPWNIVAYDLGDPAAFNIQWDRSSNTLMIQASKLYTYGNLAVRLRG